MTAFVDRILQEFHPDLGRFWIVADPDDVLLNEQVLAGLRERGFDVIPFEDSVAFRLEYEERYRSAWDSGSVAPAAALIPHLPRAEEGDLPWDYERQARKVSLSLAELFPKLSYAVVRALGNEILPTLFDAQQRHAPQTLGETATKEFVLLHVYRISPHLISTPEDFWRELLRLHYRDATLPRILADHVGQVLGQREAFRETPIAELWANKSLALRLVQHAWYQYLGDMGISGVRAREPAVPEYLAGTAVPFADPGIRTTVDSMFLDGTLHPLQVQSVPGTVPAWIRPGILRDRGAMRDLVGDGITKLGAELPGADSPYRDWLNFARRFGEVLSRFHSIDSVDAERLQDQIIALQRAVDDRLLVWVREHYANLPSLPAAQSPVMVHQVPRFLSLRQGAGEDKVALLVFDGLALDQWVQIRESLLAAVPTMRFDESACFAWLPTLTAVSRQALFSGLRPREFADSIETTSREPALWSRFWQDHGLRPQQVLYRKSIKRMEDLPELEASLSDPTIKVAGIVVDTVDEIVHGAVLGKRGIASQIETWCESGFVRRLFEKLDALGFHVYLTADHGNVDAIGSGQPKEGVAPEQRGQRVRTYRSEGLIGGPASAREDTFRLDIPALPPNYFPLFSGARTAFLPVGTHAVVHGGVSVEELIVPFVKVNPSNAME
jgi:hypothetical protein